ncbi:MAG: hypothetical protein DRJ10_00340 [Bacteroidetes bacterium]|nr:MAG: hypothetical protein DRJ10_00340 [Bacteroidota bacterium]
MHTEITKTLNNYNLGKLKTYNLLTNGFANENYRIETEKGVFLYRICKQQSLIGVSNEINFLQILKKAKFPVAYPLQRNDAKYIGQIKKSPVIIYEFIEGEIPKLNGKTVKEIGKAVAKLNLLGGHESFQNKHVINVENAIELINQFDKAKYQYIDIYKDFSEAFNYLKDRLGKNLPKGFIHGDVFPDNTIFNGNRLMAIIDFEMFCVDTLLFDVGMTINGFCFENNRLDLRLLKSFLNAYESVRALSKNEKMHLSDYILWTAVGMASWHLRNDMLNVKNEKQTARVKELLNRYKEVKNLNLKFT